MKNILFNEESKEVEEVTRGLNLNGISAIIKKMSIRESLLEYKSSEYSLFITGHTLPTMNVVRGALDILEIKPGRKKVSSFMILENIGGKFLFFADCAVNINPSEEDLVQIAFDTASSFFKITENKPRIAFISYSTHGSGKGESVDKVKKAYKLFTKKYPNIFADGELQIDAALSLDVYKKKTGKDLIEPFNIFIFQNLDTANTVYKVAAKLGNMKSYGPFIIGFEKPLIDLSRSATSDEIYKTALLGLKL